MADNLKPEYRRKTMQAIKEKGTRPERYLFSMLAGMGLKGWEKNVRAIAGKPDIVFFDKRVAIFIDGCFWHGCPNCGKKIPETNRDYWAKKIGNNILASESINKELLADGWVVVRIWEHEVYNQAIMGEIKAKIKQALDREPTAHG